MAERSGTGPPALLVFTTFLLFCLTLTLCLVGGPGPNLLGFASGSILGMANLAVFLVVDNQRRATKRYADWTVSPRTFVPWFTLVCWAFGAWNMFFWSLDWTRGT